ncbi:MAG: hypothetical protein VX438_03410, partial [Planctomycetota bacterium]|nr:hypothetical protein [Planctomycetota bacterium]
MKPIYRFLFLFLLPSLVLSGQDPRSTDQPDGLRENRPNHFALTHANVVVSPGQTRDNVTIVVQGGTIQSVLADPSKIPPGAKHIDFKGKTIYPGLIDSYSPVEIPAERIEQGAGHWNSNIRPQIDTARGFQMDLGLNRSLRQQGFGTRLLVPSGGIFKGSSALISTADTSVQQVILKTNVAQHAVLTVPRRSSFGEKRPSYPNSPMGAVALARQTLLDAQWYQLANQTAKADRSLPRPNQNDSLAALQP